MDFPVRYEPAVTRAPIAWPNNARIAVQIVVNVEYFEPGVRATSVNPRLAEFMPDVYNHSWRDYGVRAGIWRMLRVLEKLDIPANVALNALVCEHYPQIIDALGSRRGWEIMGHGMTNSRSMNGLDIDEERELIGSTLDMIERATGKRPCGWLSPALSETWNTAMLLEEVGVQYVCDWINDDEPYRMQTPKGKLIAMPYSCELNDLQLFLRAGYDAPRYKQLLLDQFEVLYEEAADGGTMMTIPTHPFVMGHPFRAKYFEEALREMRNRPGVWFTTGSQIANAWAAQERR